jgi:hypothetical protein
MMQKNALRGGIVERDTRSISFEMAAPKYSPPLFCPRNTIASAPIKAPGEEHDVSYPKYRYHQSLPTNGPPITDQTIPDFISIQRENEIRLKAMDSKELQNARNEILESLSPSIITKLTKSAVEMRQRLDCIQESQSKLAANGVQAPSIKNNSKHIEAYDSLKGQSQPAQYEARYNLDGCRVFSSREVALHILKECFGAQLEATLTLTEILQMSLQGMNSSNSCSILWLDAASSQLLEIFPTL